MRIAPPINKPHSVTFLFYVRSILNCAGHGSRAV
jgi:hypothetical protein